MTQIRVKTNGEIELIEVDYIQDYIKDDGVQYSIAYKDDNEYKVVDRDFDGAIFAKTERNHERF